MIHAWAFATLLLIHIAAVFAENFCSKDNQRVKCVPCVDLDNSSTLYRCPKQCDNNLNNQHFCNKVCNKFCLNSVCEYEDGSLKCSEGCKDALTGRYCLESCPGGCKTCGQFKPDCTSCKDGFTGMDCTTAQNETTNTTGLDSTISTQSPATGGQATTAQMHRQTTHEEVNIESINNSKQNIGQFGITIAGILPFVLLLIVIAVLIKRKATFRRRPETREPLHPEIPISKVDIKQDSEDKSCQEIRNRNDTNTNTNTNIPGRKLNPYALVKVIDADCAPEHLVQAAMITAPPILPFGVIYDIK